MSFCILRFTWNQLWQIANFKKLYYTLTLYLIANCPVLANSNNFWPLNISCCKEPLKLGEEDVTMEPASIPPICISVYPIWLAVPMISAVEKKKEIRSKLHLKWILFSHFLGETKAFPEKIHLWQVHTKLILRCCLFCIKMNIYSCLFLWYHT